VGRARFVKKYPEGFTGETPIPSAIFLSFILSPIVLIAFSKITFFSTAYLAILGLYCLIVIVSGFIEAVSRKCLIPGLMVSMGIWTIHMGLGWGFLKAIIFSKDSITTPAMR
jgi:hypothetical protein